MSDADKRLAAIRAAAAQGHTTLVYIPKFGAIETTRVSPRHVDLAFRVKNGSLQLQMRHNEWHGVDDVRIATRPPTSGRKHPSRTLAASPAIVGEPPSAVVSTSKPSPVLAAPSAVAPKITVEMRETTKGGKLATYGVIKHPGGEVKSNTFVKAESALSHARTIAMNINGDASGGGIYKGKAEIIEKLNHVGRMPSPHGKGKIGLAVAMGGLMATAASSILHSGRAEAKTAPPKTRTDPYIDGVGRNYANGRKIGDRKS